MIEAVPGLAAAGGPPLANVRAFDALEWGQSILADIGTLQALGLHLGSDVRAFDALGRDLGQIHGGKGRADADAENCYNRRNCNQTLHDKPPCPLAGYPEFHLPGINCEPMPHLNSNPSAKYRAWSELCVLTGPTGVLPMSVAFRHSHEGFRVGTVRSRMIHQAGPTPWLDGGRHAWRWLVVIAVARGAFRERIDGQKERSRTVLEPGGILGGTEASLKAGQRSSIEQLLREQSPRLLVASRTHGSLHCFQGIGAELERDTLSDPVAFDDITRLHIVGQNHHLFANSAACFLHLAH